MTKFIINDRSKLILLNIPKSIRNFEGNKKSHLSLHVNINETRDNSKNNTFIFNNTCSNDSFIDVLEIKDSLQAKIYKNFSDLNFLLRKLGSKIQSPSF